MNKIAVLDFGGQYAHLIANRVRRLHVYAEILPPSTSLSSLGEFGGLIFSGGPSSVYAEDAPELNPDILKFDKPILGICYGHQLLCRSHKGVVEPGQIHEFGAASLQADTSHPLFKGLSDSSTVWMSHGDEVKVLPEGFRSIASTSNCRFAAVAHDKACIYGLQFHPEVTHTQEGLQVLDNFLNICGVAREWDMKSYFKVLEKDIQKKAEGKKVFLLVSGGVDSSVTFALLNKVLGADKVMGLHIDNGLMRKGESEDIIGYMRTQGFTNLKICNAEGSFLKKLKGVVKPEEKRFIIGAEFIEVLGREVHSFNLNPNDCLMAQGTTYPDTIESGGTKNSATIKTHHNRVPEVLELLEKGLIIEPVAELYKDEIRELGSILGLPDKLIWRHPFPGPGLGVRLLCNHDQQPDIDSALTSKLGPWLQARDISGEVLPIKSVGVQGDGRTYAHPCLIRSLTDWDKCEKISTDMTNEFRQINRVVLEVARCSSSPYTLVNMECTREPLDVLRDADDICTAALFKHNLYKDIWQMPVVLPPLQIDGKPVIILRPINSAEAMTASFFKMDRDVLEEIWDSLSKTGVGALFYDVTHKPPGTIEWE